MLLFSNVNMIKICAKTCFPCIPVWKWQSYFTINFWVKSIFKVYMFVVYCYLYQITHNILTFSSVVHYQFRFESSPLKPLGQINRSLVGSIYRRFSMMIAHFVLIC
jgi:hypothetical protein